MSNISLKDNELLENLKKECDMLEISYTKNATVNSLTKKIRAFKEASDEGVLEVNNVKSASDTEKERISKMMHDARKLVRVEITCNDPKIRVRGQIFRSVSNRYVSLRKVIPLEVPTHVPQLILDNLRESKYLTFVKKKVNGGETAVPKEVPTYNIRELKPLNREEFKRIQIRQQADQAIGDD
jgi:hypothetical protein